MRSPSSKTRFTTFSQRSIPLSQHSKEQIPEKIALHYLLCGGSQLDEETLQILDQKYPYYMVMALAIQKDSGIEDLLFASSLEKTLTSQFALQFISLDKFSFAVLARPEEKEEILAVLQEAAEEASKTTRLFVGHPGILYGYPGASDGIQAGRKLPPLRPGSSHGKFRFPGKCSGPSEKTAGTGSAEPAL